MRIRHLTIAAATAISLLAGGAALAQNPQADAEWEILHLDEQGNEVSRARSFESVAAVQGPRALRLEIGCNRNDRRFLRIRFIPPEGSNRTPDILGERFRPLVSVFFKQDRIFFERLERWNYNPNRGSYQGRNDPKLNEAIAEGLRIDIEAPQQDFRAPFSLDGSKRILEEIDCR